MSKNPLTASATGISSIWKYFAAWFVMLLVSITNAAAQRRNA